MAYQLVVAVEINRNYCKHVKNGAVIVVWLLNLLLAIHGFSTLGYIYLKPSFLYPAASAYQLANGVIQRLSQGLLIIKLASEGTDMVKCRTDGGK